MAIKLLNEEKPEGIWVGDMKDGDIGVIVTWDSIERYVGRIVQRYKNYLIVVGADSNYGWGEVFPYDKDSLSERCCGCRVRLLRKGEKLIVI